MFFKKSFLPLFITQFLGAFNDNLLKNALVMLVTYRIAVEQHQNAQILVTLAAGLFILPFFLFSATAGQFADKYDRAQLTRIIKIAEILIMLCASIGFYTQHINFLLFSLFCMGTHSTFFGPIKYALLPQHLPEKDLLSGNAYIEAGTFLAILLGTILGGLLILQPQGVSFISFSLIGLAIIGYISSRFIPIAPAPEPEIKINYNIWSETCKIIGFSRQNKKVFLSILGISWFWLIGATFLSQFPTYAKDVLHGDETLVTLFLTIFSLGIGIGSIWCNKLLKGQIQSTYVPLAALGISIFTIDLYFASNAFTNGTSLISALDFLKNTQGLHIIIDLLLIAVCSGIYIVPLYAIMQHSSEPLHRARIIAANNVLNAAFMVVSALLTVLLLKLSYTIPQIFLFIAIINGCFTIYYTAFTHKKNLVPTFRNIKNQTILKKNHETN